MASRPRVLFLCTHNSARSQMAEGLLRHLSAGLVEAYSAGLEETEVRPLAIAALAEIGVDIRSQRSKTLDRYQDQAFDLVITTCDDAQASCPAFPNARRNLHWSLPDPSAARGPQAEQLAVFRRVRDALRIHVQQLLAELAT